MSQTCLYFIWLKWFEHPPTKKFWGADEVVYTPSHLIIYCFPGELILFAKSFSLFCHKIIKEMLVWSKNRLKWQSSVTLHASKSTYLVFYQDYLHHFLQVGNNIIIWAMGKNTEAPSFPHLWNDALHFYNISSCSIFPGTWSKPGSQFNLEKKNPDIYFLWKKKSQKRILGERKCVKNKKIKVTSGCCLERKDGKRIDSGICIGLLSQPT